MELVDPKLEYDFDKDEAIRMIKVAILCTNPSPALRPTMSSVLSMLEGQTPVHDLLMDPSIYGDEERFTALREQFNQIALRSPTATHSLIPSSDAKSSDLYKVNPSSMTISGNDIYPISESQTISTISSLTSHGTSRASD